MTLRLMSVGTPRMRRLILLGAVLLVAETGSARQIETPGEKGQSRESHSTYSQRTRRGSVSQIIWQATVSITTVFETRENLVAIPLSISIT